MKTMRIVDRRLYDKGKRGYSIVSGGEIYVIGDRLVEYTDRLGNTNLVEQYVYNIIGYASENGAPFVALKSNIVLEDE